MSTDAELKEIAENIIEAGLAEADTQEIENQLGQRLRQELLSKSIATPSWAQGGYGASDIAKKFIDSQYIAIRNELCDCEAKRLKPEYSEFLSPTYSKAIAAASIGAGILRAFEVSIPELAIPALAIYTALILIRANLQQWCSEGC